MKFLTSLIQKVCQPNPKTLYNDFEKEIVFKRNRAMFLVLLFVSFIVIIYSLFFARPEAIMPKIGLFGNLAITIIFVLTCRSYLFYFKLFYFIYLTSFGPLTLYLNPDSIFFNTSAIYIMPLFVLYLMGARPFIIQVIIQILYLHIIYKEKLIQTLNEMDVTAYVHRATTISTLALLMNVGLIYSTQSDLIKAHHQIAIEKLKKADLERQKTFLLSFSHEIRNLINTVIGSVQLSKMEVLTPKVQDFLSTSEICGELLLHLVNNILDSGKVEIGELEVNPSINIVSETLEKVWNICSHQIKSKRLQGKMRIQKDLPNKLKIDNYRLLQILMNLVGNPIKFTQTGKINIDVKWLPSKKRITQECFEPIPFDKENEGIFEKDQTFSLLDNNLISLDFHRTKIAKGSFINKASHSQYGVLKIIVTDTGCGIPQEKIPLIFDKFSQVADDPSKRKMGTGLGLFITKQLVLKMGGEIKVFSKLNHGTAFTVCIPAESVQDEEIQHTLTIESFAEFAKKKQLKAMIVDDIEFNLFVLANSMNKLGIQLTSVARNGQEAFDMYKSQIEKNQPLDIITLDIDMPIMDGKKVLKLIRNYEMEFRLKPCLIVMVSANCSESEIQDCLGSQMKANFFLKKPASVLDFFQVLKTLYKKNI